MKITKITAGLCAGALAFSGVAGWLPVKEFSLTAYAAESGVCGENLTWTLDDEGTLTISGTGAMEAYTYTKNPPWYSSKESIKKIVVEDGVTSIGKYAFNEYNALTDITIPGSVTSIGISAFSSCGALTNITIPKGVTEIGNFAFDNCKKLTKVTISDGVTSIGDMSFYNCTSLSEITIPKSVIYFGGYAFQNTPWLEMQLEEGQLLIINNSVIDGTKCSGDITVPNNVISISGYAFSSCKELTGISIPDSVTVIGESAFSNCSSLTNITVPGSVTSIGSAAFSNTPWLEERQKENPLVIVNSMLIDGRTCSGDVIIPDGVTQICGNAFYLCEKLKSITIPESVTSIGIDAFGMCTLLHSVTIPKSVTSIEARAFSSCKNLSSIMILNPDCVIFDGLTTFPNDNDRPCEIYGYINSTAQAYAEKYGYTFKSLGEAPSSKSGMLGDNVRWELNDDGVLTISGDGIWREDIPLWLKDETTSVVIKPGVKEIPFAAFWGYTKMTSVSLPDNLEYISNYAFQECCALTSVTIPDSVSQISEGVFRNCSGLVSVSLPADISSISIYAFENCTSLTKITLPRGLNRIYYNAFAGCTALETVNFPDCAVNIGRDVFKNTKWLENQKKAGAPVIAAKCVIDGSDVSGEYTVPDDVQYIGEYAFDECAGLKSVTLPESVKEITNCAFLECSALESVTILNPNCKMSQNRESLICNSSKENDTVIYTYNGVIRGYDGSTAEAYAKKCGYTFESLGEAPATEPFPDMDGNNEITANDAQIVLIAYADIVTGNDPDLTPEQLSAADVDGNDEVTALDAQYILTYYLYNSVLDTPTTWDDILHPNGK